MQRLEPAHRTTPGKRAIAGGILIAVAVLGTFAGARHNATAATTTVVVAAHDLAPGTVLKADDVRTTRIAVDAQFQRHGASRATTVMGATLLGPVAAGEIVQNGNLTTTASPLVEVALSLPAPRALDGVLRSGDKVDILTTDKGSDATAARLAASSATVLRAGSSRSNTRSGEVVITIGLRTSSEAASVVAANDQGLLTLVRTTGSSGLPDSPLPNSSHGS